MEPENLDEREIRVAERRRALEGARRSRASIVELAVRAEYLLGEALAWHIAYDEAAAALLQEHMVWRVPVAAKLKLLSDVIEAHELSDLFPFVVPVLTELFRIRNTLAHSLEIPVPSEHEIGFLGVHRGHVSEHSLRMDFLDWLRQQGEQVFDELSLISGAIIDGRVQPDD